MARKREVYWLSDAQWEAFSLICPAAGVENGAWMTDV